MIILIMNSIAASQESVEIKSLVFLWTVLVLCIKYM